MTSNQSWNKRRADTLSRFPRPCLESGCSRHSSLGFTQGAVLKLTSLTPRYYFTPALPRAKLSCPPSLPPSRGNKTASASLGFPFPVPAMAVAGWRGYFFANLGNLTTWDTPLRQYGRDTRVSVGVAAGWNFLGKLL